jgi:SAM-dependent methyltransferase
MASDHAEGHQRHGMRPEPVEGHHRDPGFDETTVFDAAFWNNRYASAPTIWSGNPNPQLVTEASGLAPTTALDVGCGEGADAVWLAERGWQVTALDISQVALDRAGEHARQSAPESADRITWQQADLTEGLPLEPGFGLVSVQFLHVPPGQRDPLYLQLAELVAPGGTLLIVGHDPSDLESAGHLRAHRPDLLFTADDIAGLLDPAEWTITADSRGRSVVDPDGRRVEVADAVVVARRR